MKWMGILFLTRVEGLESVLIIGCTNRVSELDEALIRPGRFDMHVEIKLPNDKDRVMIWKSFETRFLLLLNRVEMEEIVKRTEGFTGADMEMVVREGALDAIRKAQDSGDEVQGVFYRNLENAFQGIGKWWNPGLGKEAAGV